MILSRHSLQGSLESAEGALPAEHCPFPGSELDMIIISGAKSFLVRCVAHKPSGGLVVATEPPFRLKVHPVCQLSRTAQHWCQGLIHTLSSRTWPAQQGLPPALASLYSACCAIQHSTGDCSCPQCSHAARPQVAHLKACLLRIAAAANAAMAAAVSGAPPCPVRASGAALTRAASAASRSSLPSHRRPGSSCKQAFVKG